MGRGETLLDAPIEDLASFDLDPARHLQRLNIGKGSDAYAFAPRSNLARGPSIGAPCMGVTTLCAPYR